MFLKKITYLSITAVALAACGPKDSESDYQFSISETDGIVQVALDDILNCKGKAMMGRKQEAYQCFDEYLEKHGEGSRYDIATDEFFTRVEIDKSREKDPRYLAIVRRIAMISDARNYLFEYSRSRYE